jgi:hypothetical protein
MSTSDYKGAPEEATCHVQEPSQQPIHPIWGTQLQPGQIRLFGIEIDWLHDIRGTLETFEHNSAPGYIAQSYVCGDGECNVMIAVNGYAYYIKPSLAIALHQTKLALFERNAQDGPYTNAWVWIDAICIDQSNVAELQAQIRFMDRVYKRATATFISLGKWSESQRLLVRFFEWADADAKMSCLREERESRSIDGDGARVIDAAHTQQKSLEWSSNLQADFDMSAEDARTINDELKGPLGKGLGNVRPFPQALHYTHPFWQACMEFFEADWFSRLWTFQELWLSPDPCVTLHRLLHWNRFAYLPDRIDRLATAPDGWSRVTGARHENYLLQSWSLKFHKHVAITDDLWILLYITAKKRAKVPKDHVFASRGLMDANTQRLVDVDYSKTDAQVFQDTLLLAMRSTTTANKLPKHWELFASVPTPTPGLASWVPDLNNETNAHVGYWCTLGFSTAVTSAFDDAAHFRVSQENGPLLLNVLEMDVVSIPGGEPLSAHVPTQRAIDGVLVWIKGLYNTMASGEDDLPAFKERLGAFFAIIAGLRKEEMAPLCFLIAASELIEKDLTFNEVVLHVRKGLHTTHELRRGILEITNTGPDHEALIESLMSVAHRFRARFVPLGRDSTYIFTTLGGRVGCSPRPVSAGERICIVPGGELLHILSALPSRYITCAAVHGLMGDDLPDFVRELGREWEEIAIH